MVNISRTRVIAAAPQAVWDVLADFGAIDSWVDGVAHSSLLTSGPGGVGLGTTRRVQVGRTALVERIGEFDPPLALAYEISGLPKFVGRLANRWTLRPSGTGTTVTLTSSIDIGTNPVAHGAERVVGRVVSKRSDAMLDGLKAHLERS